MLANHNLKTRAPFLAQFVITEPVVRLPMSMEITWLDFQLSTDNQNGRHLATTFFFSTYFFFIISLKPGIYRFSGSVSLLHYPFSRATENEAMAAIFIF